MESMKCQICGNQKIEKVIQVQDLNLGTTEFFEYFQCCECKCLQIKDIPENLSQYYGGLYYSFSMSKKKKGMAERLISYFQETRDIRSLSNKRGIIGKVCNKFQPREAYDLVRKLAGNLESSIIDVGCGDGYLLRLMEKVGYTRLIGIDPYLTEYSTEHLQLKKDNIFNVEGKYDFIMFHHSFEHMEKPHDVMSKVAKLLKDETSHCMICVPISTSDAFEHYGQNWVQLDAPRHLFLHSPLSIKYLANEVGLEVVDTIYDSNSFQYWGSELYKQGIPGTERRNFIRVVDYAWKSFIRYSAKAKKANKEQKGDQAIFILKLQ